VIYHDAVVGDVYVSEDKGKNWALADGVPQGQAKLVLEHPFHNDYAFILTAGRTHYQTEDGGKTWWSFEMPVQPAYVPNPLSFHSDRTKYGYILYQGMVCGNDSRGSVCYQEVRDYTRWLSTLLIVPQTYYTKQAFSDTPTKLLSDTTQCLFAHSSDDFKHDAHTDLIYCIAYDTSSLTGQHSLSSSRLFSSTDFFATSKVEDLGIGQNAKGVLGFSIVSKFAIVALKDLTPSSNGEVLLYKSMNTKDWTKVLFPDVSSARLRENEYTIVEPTTHSESLVIDVMLQGRGGIGTLFTSNSNGTYFVESLGNTNRNELGYMVFENLYAIDGIWMTNVVANAMEVEGRGAVKQLKSLITFDHGWNPI
jgi:hypothetical protein